MSTPQIQPLSEAAILAATDELVATVPELVDATPVSYTHLTLPTNREV